MVGLKERKEDLLDILEGRRSENTKEWLLLVVVQEGLYYGTCANPREGNTCSRFREEKSREERQNKLIHGINQEFREEKNQSGVNRSREKKDNDSGNRFREENQKVQGTRDRVEY